MFSPVYVAHFLLKGMYDNTLKGYPTNFQVYRISNERVARGLPDRILVFGDIIYVLGALIPV